MQLYLKQPSTLGLLFISTSLTCTFTALVKEEVKLTSYCLGMGMFTMSVILHCRVHVIAVCKSSAHICN